METRKLVTAFILVAVFVLVALIRLDIAFSSELGDYKSFDVLRHVESIKTTGQPLFDDPLSFGGRQRLFAPLFYYVMTMFSFIFSDTILVKVVPNLFAAAIIFPAYYLAQHLTNNKVFSVLSSFFAGLVPAAFMLGINDASVMTLSVTLLFIAAYLFIKSRKKGKHTNWLLALLIILPFLDVLSAILLVAMFIYLFLLKVQSIPVKGKDVEFSLFFLFYTGWVTLILFKKALLLHGTSVIWQNIPLIKLSEQFSSFTLIDAVSSTGLIPLFAGSVGLFIAITRTKKKAPLFLVSIITACALLLWFRLVPLAAGLYVFGITLAIASGFGLHEWYVYLRKTKISKFSSFIIAGVVLLFFVLSVSSWTHTANTPQYSDVQVLSWAQGNLQDAVILAPAQLGFFIQYHASHKTVIDEDFLLIPRIDERYEDTLLMYRLFFTTDMIGIMEKYGATHIFMNDRVGQLTNSSHPPFSDDDCFELLYQQGSSRLYELTCQLRDAS